MSSRSPKPTPTSTSPARRATSSRPPTVSLGHFACVTGPSRGGSSCSGRTSRQASVIASKILYRKVLFGVRAVHGERSDRD